MKSNFTIFQISYIKRNLTNLIVILICLVCFTKSQEGEESSLNIKLNPPEENPKETIAAINDLFKLENDLRIGLNEDFDTEKKKMIEIQKSRIHDIVHGSFIALNSLIPNPIKSSIRKSIRDYVSGMGTRDIPNTDVAQAVNILDPTNYKAKAHQLQSSISKLAQFRQKFNDIEENDLKNLVDSNKIELDYGSPEDNNQRSIHQNQKFLNSELYDTNFPVMKPL